MITKLDDFINTNITIPDAAWLYFLYYVYDGKLEIKDWGRDNRMNGQNCLTSLAKFKCVTIDDKNITCSDECLPIIDKYFGTKTFEESVKMKYELKDLVKGQGTTNRTFPINEIPYDLYLIKHKAIESAFERISNIITKHYNSQISNPVILERLCKMKHIDKWSYVKAMDEYDGQIPERIKIYRGIKSKYDPTIKNEYSCWTTSLKEAKRFAKYHFTGGRQFDPIIAKEQYVLESEVSFNDIAVFIDGDEHEIIMAGNVKINNIINDN